jgi:superfamily II DNA helicase RecQ
MLIKLFTLEFDDGLQGFDNDIVYKFCMNKKIHEIKTEFFIHKDTPYCHISIIYDTVIEEKPGPAMFNEEELLLMQRLKEWRRQRAGKEGFPVYLICNNKQLEQLVRDKCTTLARLKEIKGFGKAKVEKFGKEITGLIAGFYSQQEKGNKKHTCS